MSLNYLYATVSALCCIFILIIVILYYRSKNKSTNIYFYLISFSVFMWSFIVIFKYLINDQSLNVSIQMYKFIGIALNPVFTYLFINKQITTNKISSKKMVLFFIIPTLTSIFSIFNDNFHFMFDGYAFVNNINVNHYTLHYNFWFYVHLVYSYIFVIQSYNMLTKMYFLSPKQFRKTVSLMLSAIFLVIVTNVVSVFNLFTIYYDYTIIATTLSLGLLFLAVEITNSTNMIITSKEYIFNNLSNNVLVLDEYRKILTCNKSTEKLFGQTEDKLYKLDFDSFFKSWLAEKKTVISSYNENIFTIYKEGKEFHFNIVIKEYFNVHYGVEGYFVQITEITDVFKLFRYLEDSAHIDQLTGINNRNSFSNHISDLTSKEKLPVGVIVGDVNLLKKINDSKGHIAGDELLMAVAKILTDNSPENAFVSRIGGDEFSIIIPNSNAEQCASIIAQINSACLTISHDLFGTPSISLGHALMTHVSEDIKLIINEADIMMYKDKNDRRVART